MTAGFLYGYSDSVCSIIVYDSRSTVGKHRTMIEMDCRTFVVLLYFEFAYTRDMPVIADAALLLLYPQTRENAHGSGTEGTAIHEVHARYVESVYVETSRFVPYSSQRDMRTRFVYQ